MRDVLDIEMSSLYFFCMLLVVCITTTVLVYSEQTWDSRDGGQNVSSSFIICGTGLSRIIYWDMGVTRATLLYDEYEYEYSTHTGGVCCRCSLVVILHHEKRLRLGHQQ